MFIISKEELEHLTEAQLREIYHGIIADCVRRNISAMSCPLTMITLENIQTVLRRKRALKPSAPCF